MSSRLSSLRHYGRQGAVPALVAVAAATAFAGFILSVRDPGMASYSAPGIALLLLSVVCCALAAGLWSARRETARVRRALSAGLSHDLRTPLAQIRMFTEMLLMDLHHSSDERTEWLETIERETHRLGDVLDNLLLFIHGHEPNPFPARQVIDMGALVEDVAAGFSDRAAGSGAKLVVDPPTGVHVLADPQALRQAVVNLLDNALRFGSSGQTITVTVRTDAERAVLSVADEGPGIPAKDRGSVWKPFVRLENTSDENGGGGLGLAVVRRVVELHEGNVWIEDAVGGGAIVSLSLPTARSPSAAGRQHVAVPTAAAVPH